MKKKTKQHGLIGRFAREERGTQLVELAIVLPVMLMMMAATAEFGRFFYTYTTLAKATRAGARYLASSAVKCGEADRARNLVIYGNVAGEGEPIVSGLTMQNVQVQLTGNAAPTLPETVTVEIESFTYQQIFDLGKITGHQNLSLNIDVRPRTTMRYLLTQPPVC